MIATTYPLTVQHQIDRLLRIATQRPGRNTQVSLGGLSVQQPRGGAAAVDWWLSGGISAANCIAAYQPKGAASLAASYINLATPGTNNVTIGVAPSFDTTTGWTFNGSTQYLIAGNVIPTNDQKYSIIIQYSNSTTVGGVLVGALNSGGSLAIWPNYYGNAVRYENGGITTKATGVGTGNLCVAGNKCYRNGVDEGITISVWTGVSEKVIYIGARNNNNFPANLCNGIVTSIAIYGNTALTALQVAALALEMVAL